MVGHGYQEDRSGGFFPCICHRYRGIVAFNNGPAPGFVDDLIRRGKKGDAPRQEQGCTAYKGSHKQVRVMLWKHQELYQIADVALRNYSSPGPVDYNISRDTTTTWETCVETDIFFQ